MAWDFCAEIWKFFFSSCSIVLWVTEERWFSAASEVRFVVSEVTLCCTLSFFYIAFCEEECMFSWLVFLVCLESVFNCFF